MNKNRKINGYKSKRKKSDGHTVGIMAHYWNGGYTIGMVAILRWLTIGMVAILLELWLYYWNSGYNLPI